MSQMRKTPEFNEPTEDAFLTCLEVGAVLFPYALVPHDEHHLLDTIILPPTKDEVVRNFPFFARMASIIGGNHFISHLDEFHVQPSISKKFLPNGHQAITSHVDSEGRFGFTCLFPAVGNPVVFIASDDEFTAKKEESGEITIIGKDVLMSEYGVGDVMMIRQEMTHINGSEWPTTQTHHGAFSHHDRRLLAFDYISTQIELNFTQDLD